jgi:aryl carrier-like protein
MPPLRGIIHAAGVLDDAILLQSDQERFKKVMAPKIKGAWHLHTLTRDKILDFFVLFSSAASLLGSPGQGNYSAANAFLDGLAYHRQAQGLPALSINWGPWAEVGLAAQPDRASQLAARGIMSIAPEQGVEALSRLLGQGPVQVLVMPINWIQYRQLYPPGRELPLLTHLIRKEADVLRKTSASVGKDNLFTRDVLLATEPGERRQLLESYLREQVAKVLGLSPSRLDVRESLNSLGIDSLMAVELKNRIERSLEVAVSMVQFLRGPSVQQLTALLLDQLTTTTPPSFPPDRAVIKDQIRQKEDSSTDARHLLAKIDQLSDEEVNTLLDDMLAPGDDK